MTDENKSRAELDQEKHKWAMKYFDYAENPIKEWISDLLDEDITAIFDDYTEDSDILSVEDQGNYYTLYLTAYPEKTPSFHASKDDLMNNKIVNKSTSMMFESVYTVYAPVVQSMSSMKHKLENIFPKFDEKLMCFYFSMVNSAAAKRQQVHKNLIKISDQFKQLREVNTIDSDEKINNERNEQKVELEKQLILMQTEELENLSKLGDDVCDKEEEECKRMNEIYKNSSKLYICLDMNKTDQDNEQVMKRMPKFGLNYQDPDEDNYIDKLKKEYEIKDNIG
jgi:hypothetical protein